MRFEVDGLPAASNAITALHIRRDFAKAHTGAQPVSKIVKMAFGNGGCDVHDVPIPPDPSKDPLALNHQVGEKALDSSVIDIGGTNVVYQATLLNSELNGYKINECALVDDRGNVAAMATFGGKVKSDDVMMVFKWTEMF